jgi:epoxyqueuosine reductase
MLVGELKLKNDSNVEKLTSEVREIALNSGASLVGVVSASAVDSLPRVWVGWKIQQYTKTIKDAMPEAKSVVVAGYHVWDDMLELAIKKGEKWVYPGYLPLAVLAQSIIKHLEANGYRAASGGLLPYKRLAQLAGFGNYGKNALIVNPEYGPWIRLTAILTDAELTPDKPFEEDLCGKCENCIRACPVGALTPYKVDADKCLVGILIADKENPEYVDKLREYEPSLSKNASLMCMKCQKACRYGKKRHS